MAATPWTLQHLQTGRWVLACWGKTTRNLKAGPGPPTTCLTKRDMNPRMYAAGEDCAACFIPISCALQLASFT